jgi:hypothetical protein
MKNFVWIGGVALFIAMWAAPVIGQPLSNYLILNNIGSFKASQNPSSGQGPGSLAGAGHFYHDHVDRTYSITYFNLQTKVGPEVQVTQHAGGDSDRWLLHELEGTFRRNPEQSQFKGIIREVNGKRIFTYLRGTHYRWTSANVVVDIQYTDLEKAKPEPLEIITAYLQKFPSTIPAMVMDQSHDEQWIKDEMERRLWLGDKWAAQGQTDQADLTATLEALVKHLRTFLEYREKYYGVAGRDEQIALIGFRDAQDGTAIKNKLAEYKTWWAANRTGSINLP